MALRIYASDLTKELKRLNVLEDVQLRLHGQMEILSEQVVRREPMASHEKDLAFGTLDAPSVCHVFTMNELAKIVERLPISFNQATGLFQFLDREASYTMFADMMAEGIIEDTPEGREFFAELDL